MPCPLPLLIPLPSAPSPAPQTQRSALGAAAAPRPPAQCTRPAPMPMLRSHDEKGKPGDGTPTPRYQYVPHGNFFKITFWQSRGNSPPRVMGPRPKNFKPIFWPEGELESLCSWPAQRTSILFSGVRRHPRCPLKCLCIFLSHDPGQVNGEVGEDGRD